MEKSNGGRPSATGRHCKKYRQGTNFYIVLKINEVIRYIRDNKIDLVHCHLPWAGFAGRYIHKRTGIPVIYSEHNKQERYHWITKYINKYSFNFQTKAIAVSADVAESIRKNIIQDSGSNHSQWRKCTTFLYATRPPDWKQERQTVLRPIVF